MQVALVLALLTLAGVGLYALQSLSGAANRVEQGKDVVADILPSPLYIIEAQLTSYDLLRASAAQRAPLLEKLRALRNDYDRRNRYWETSTLEPRLKGPLLGRQRQQADLFWQTATRRFMPAIEAGDAAAAQAALRDMRGYYEAHRQAVDATVNAGRRYAEDTLKGFTRTAQRAKWLLGSVAGLGCLAVLGFAVPSLKRLYQELRASEERFRAIFAQAAVGVALIEAGSGRFLRINQRYCDIVGYTPEEMQHTTAQAITHPGDLDADANQMRRLGEGAINEFTLEQRYLHKNGSVVWVSLTLSLMGQPGAAPHSYIAVAQNITERKLMEDRLRQQLVELTRWQEVILGREERVQELKKEINDLLMRLGQPIRYSSQAGA